MADRAIQFDRQTGRRILASLIAGETRLVPFRQPKNGPSPGRPIKRYKLTTFPYHDATEDLHFVWAIAMPDGENDSSNPLSTISTYTSAKHPPGAVQLWIAPGTDPGNLRPGLHVSARPVGGRLELVAAPRIAGDWVPATGRFWTGSAYAPVPAYSAVGLDNPPQLSLQEFAYDSSRPLFPVATGAWSVQSGLDAEADEDFGESGLASYGGWTMAMGEPTQIRYKTGILPDAVAPRRGSAWGPAPRLNGVSEASELYPGLPQFTGYSAAIITLDDGGKASLFVQCPGLNVCLAKATAKWTVPSGSSTVADYIPYVTCNPVLAYNGGFYPYDGTTVPPYGSGTMPSIQIRVYLPRNGQWGDPNVQTGDIITYRQAGFGVPTSPIYGELPYVATGGYMDDKIGTVKMWIGALASIPGGWREYTAMRDRLPIGVYASGIATSVGATGGAQTHVHGSGSTAGASAGASAGVAANHLPPYSGLYFIERYQ